MTADLIRKCLWPTAIDAMEYLDVSGLFVFLHPVLCRRKIQKRHMQIRRDVTGPGCEDRGERLSKRH